VVRVRTAPGRGDVATNLPNHVVYALTGAVVPASATHAGAHLVGRRTDVEVWSRSAQRARVVQLLLANGAAAPRFGPRSPVRRSPLLAVLLPAGHGRRRHLVRGSGRSDEHTSSTISRRN